jgi:hypothetical protein
MKEVCVIPSRPIQALDPIDEMPLDELPDPLVPVREDDLPQGVLDLMAALIRHHRTMPAGSRGLMSVDPRRMDSQSEVAQSGAPQMFDADPDRAWPIAREPMPLSQANSLDGKSVSHLLPQRPESVASIGDTPATPNEPVALDPLPSPDARPASPIDESSHYVPLPLQGARHAPPVTRAFAPASILPPAPPTPDVLAAALPGSDRGFLHVPFNKGAARGQVTISRAPEGPTRNLTLSPSNALVLEQLKEPFELAREPAWRLADRGEEQQRQNSHHAPDDDQDEPSEHPA